MSVAKGRGGGRARGATSSLLFRSFPSPFLPSFSHRALSTAVSLPAGRIPGCTGVWCPPPSETPAPSKLAAVGVRAAGWVTYHGVALNVSSDLSPFKSIVPCGLATRPVGSVAGALGREGENARLLLAQCAEGLVDAAGRVLAVEVVAPRAAGGRVGAAAVEVEAALRAASGV